MTLARVHGGGDIGTNGLSGFKGLDSQRGFTLVEAIIVIVITGILAAIVAMFIRMPIQGYMDSVARADLTDVADTALHRMSRDLRLALPNSIRVSGQYIEFLLTSTGGLYLDDSDMPTLLGDKLDFQAADSSFIAPGPALDLTGAKYIAVYNLGIPGADAYSLDTMATLMPGSAPILGGTRINITAKQFPFASPNHRFQVVTTPVTYGCAGSTLTRYSGYAIQPGQPTDGAVLPLSAATSKAVLASDVTSCTFSYITMPNVRSALVGLELVLHNKNVIVADYGAGNVSAKESVTLFQQVHVDNTP